MSDHVHAVRQARQRCWRYAWVGIPRGSVLENDIRRNRARVRNVGFLERGDLLRSQFHGNRCERVIEVVELGGADYRCARSLAFRSQSAASTAEIAVATSPLRPRFTNATPQSFIRRGDLEGRMSGDDRAELALDQLYDRSISVGVAETALAADLDLDNDITVRSHSSVPSASGASVKEDDRRNR